jgi:mannonate dehydratase
VARAAGVPPATAGKDACHYRSEAVPECAPGKPVVSQVCATTPFPAATGPIPWVAKTAGLSYAFPVKLGLGLYRHQLNAEHYRFAKQCGCTHLVIHLVDYFRSSRSNQPGDQPVGDDTGWGLAGDPNQLWTYAELAAIKKEINAAGLELEAIENFDPAHWHDVLLDGPKKLQQLENLKTIIRNVGQAGIPIFGYNFSIAGVAGRIKGRFARGEAEAVGLDGPLDKPLPNGMVWNMVYDRNAAPGVVPSATPEQLWQRLKVFLDALVPVAEAAGVTLAAHPDDPPLPTVRAQPRLVYQPQLFQKLIDLKPSPRHALEFCVGTLAEMSEGDIYDVVDTYSRQGKLAYVHLRNVRGKVPSYKETFIDDGDVDVLRVLRILQKNNFNGVIIPDHAPQMSCAAPWHAGMAYALGFLRAGLKTIGNERG